MCNFNTGYCDCSSGFTGPSCDDGIIGKRASFREQHTIPHLLSDIRECEVKNGGCDQVCTDFPGGYNCSCRSGFETDGPSCIGMPFTLATDKCKICYGMSTDTCVNIIVVTYH